MTTEAAFNIFALAAGVLLPVAVLIAMYVLL